MTTREVLKIVKLFGFKKITVTTEQSGNHKLYHYFIRYVGDIEFIVTPDNNDKWFGSLFDFSVKFYNKDSFVDVIKAVEKGQWK